jgi:hypothetical protein
VVPIVFAQRDPEWTTDKLGTSTITIGQAGCLITSIASMLADWQIPTDPRALNRWLIKDLGYVSDNLFLWSVLSDIPGVQFVNYVDCARVAAPVTRIAQSLMADCGVVCEMDSIPGGTIQQHWVRVLEAINSGADFRVMDPWHGDICLLSERYLAPGWDASRGIMAVGTYCLVSKARQLANEGPAAPLTRIAQGRLDILA